MKQMPSLAELEDYAKDCISAHDYPNDNHLFTLYRCKSCGASAFKITIEHHTGSEEWDFKGIFWGECTGCGYLGRLFTFTGEHRQMLREERPGCECGNRSFTAGQCERYEGAEGIPGFFDEGVIVGKCCQCGLNRTFAFTD